MTNTDLSERMSRSPYRTIWELAWPQVLMMVFHFFIGMADVWVAGKINREVQASLGIITQSLFFLLVVAVAVANGGVAAISQSDGAGLHKRVKRYVSLVVACAVLLGATFFLVGMPCRELLQRALQVPEEMRYVTSYFLNVYLLILPPYYLLIATNAVFRARKQVKIPLYAMIVVTSVNGLLDLGLGLGMWGLPHLGYKGLAWATFASVTAGAICNLIVLLKQGALDPSSFPPMRWIKVAIPYLLKVAWPSGLMQIVWQSGYLVLYAITASLPYGKIDALAGMSIGLRIESLLFLPAFALNMTASILIGHYLGARDPATAKKFGFRILGIGVVSISLLTFAVWPLLHAWIGLLTEAPAVQIQASSYLKWNIIAIPFTLTSMIMAGCLNGAGATLYNMIIMGSAVWFVRLPLAWLLGHQIMQDAEGVWIAMLCSQVIQSATLLYTYSFRDWQKFAMIKKRNNKQGSFNGARI